MTKTMEVTNMLDIHTREELYSWYFENHDKVSDFWLRVNRAREPYPDVVGYVDAVEALREALSSSGRDYIAATVHKFQGSENDAIILSTVDNQVSEFTDDLRRIRRERKD